MKKQILQAVSGGFDSSYLLIKNLQNGDTVQPVYIFVSSINRIKQKIESSVVKNLIKKLQVKHDNLKDLIEADISMDSTRNIISDQPIYWTLALFKEVKKYGFYNNYDEVHIGYILQDAAISYLREIKALWKALHSFSHPDPDFVIPKLCFPLSKYHKVQIINSLQYLDDDIIDSCWNCENPDIIKTTRHKDTIEAYIEPCGNCAPCVHLKNTNNSVYEDMKKYRVILRTNDFIEDLNTRARKIIKNVDFQHIPNLHISLEEIDKKRIKK